MINVSNAKAIVEVVAADQNCRRVIQSGLDKIIPDKLGAAGGIRNVGYWARSLVKDATDALDITHAADVWEDLDCNTIAKATVNALNKALQGGSSKLRSVKRVTSIVRDTKHGNSYEHTATLVAISNETPVVFDWHANLSINNPMIYPDVMSFHLGKNSVTFDELRAMGDKQTAAEVN